jgi:hypothetical protein
MCRFTVSVLFVGCALAATPPLCSAEEYLDLPEGVIHVALPPGAMKLEYTVKGDKPLLRVSAGKAVIVARNVFLGDGKSATEFEATRRGIHWPYPDGRPGSVVGVDIIYEPGSTIGVLGGAYLSVKQLKPGSVYITTPSIKFDFRPAAKPKP